MTEAREDHNTKDAYNISNYDLVYIILKDSAEKHEGYKGLVKFDKSKKKFYLSGRIIYEEKTKYNIFPFVTEKNMEAFKKAKKKNDKREYTINIIFGHIDYITLPFDSFDWIK